MTDTLHALVVDTGVERCPHDGPPCHPPIPWIQVLAYATINGTIFEVTATLRMVKE